MQHKTINENAEMWKVQKHCFYQQTVKLHKLCKENTINKHSHTNLPWTWEQLNILSDFCQNEFQCGFIV